jgi:hypothetical protein
MASSKAQTQSLTPVLIDEPGDFATLATWERHLMELEGLPPSKMREAMINTARQMISRKKREQATK